jgi:hypothetical protein
MADAERPLCCSICLIENIRSEAIKGWLGIPICREHMAETVARANGYPVINPSPGLPVPSTLQ